VARIEQLKLNETQLSPHLLALERAGLARIGNGKLPHDFWVMPRPKDREGAALKALLQERESGR